MFSEPDLFTFRDAVRGVFRYRKSALAFFVVTVLLVGIATVLAPRRYLSESKLFVKLGRENMRLDATAALGQGPVVAGSDSRENEVNSIAEVLGSQGILGQVVDAIGPLVILDKQDPSENKPARAVARAAPPEAAESELATSRPWDRSFHIFNNVQAREKAIIQLRKNLEIEPIQRSNIVTVSYETYSPVLAQQVVRLLVDYYLEAHVRINRTTQAFEFMQQQMMVAQQELENAERQLRELNSQTQITDPDVQRGVLLARVARLEDALLETQANAQAVEVEVAHFMEALAKLEATQVTSQVTGAGNPAIDTMRGKLYELQIKREELLSRYTENHHLVQQINEQIKQAKVILAEEEVLRTQQTRGPNVTYEETRLELIKKRPVLASLHAKAEILAAQLRAVRSDLEEFNTNVLLVRAAERDVNVERNNFHKYAHNLEQARIDSQLEEAQFSNISVAQPASYNEKPVAPNKLLNLILALVLGTLGGISFAVAREYFQPQLEGSPMASPASPPAELPIENMDAEEEAAREPRRVAPQPR